MADTKKQPPKKPSRRKAPETVRERAERQANKQLKSDSKSRIWHPFRSIKKVSNKEFNPVKLPDNKYGKVLGKRIRISRIIPKFFREAWAELKNVTWPSRREAVRLTGAVVIFAVIFAIFVQTLDFIFDRVVKVIILK